MFDYLQPSDKPVIEGLEEFEIVFAKNQARYNPLRALRQNHRHGRVLSRWTLTDAQRQAVANGADIYLELLTFHEPLQPIMMAVGDAPNPDYFREQYALPAQPVTGEPRT